MNGNPDFDRERLTGLFDELSRELEFARTRVQIYVIGGAAMSMAFDRGRTTKDVGARIDAGHGALMKAVEKPARKRAQTRTRHEGREDLMKRLGISDVAEATGIHATLYAGKPMKAVEGLEQVSQELKTALELCEALEAAGRKAARNPLERAAASVVTWTGCCIPAARRLYSRVRIGCTRPTAPRLACSRHEPGRTRLPPRSSLSRHAGNGKPAARRAPASSMTVWPPSHRVHQSRSYVRGRLVYTPAP